ADCRTYLDGPDPRRRPLPATGSHDPVPGGGAVVAGPRLGKSGPGVARPASYTCEGRAGRLTSGPRGNARGPFPTEPVMSVRFKCDECNATVRLADERLGKRNYCPRCDAKLPTAAVHRNTGLALGLIAGGFVAVALAVVGAGIAAWYFAAKGPPPAAAHPPGP